MLISTLCDICKVKRIPAVLIVVASACILGIPASLGYGALDFVKILGFFYFGLYGFHSKLSAASACRPCNVRRIWMVCWSWFYL